MKKFIAVSISVLCLTTALSSCQSTAEPIKMYDSYPSVPDLGEFVEYEATERMDSGYVYAGPNITKNSVGDYIEACKDCGYVDDVEMMAAMAEHDVPDQNRYFLCNNEYDIGVTAMSKGCAIVILDCRDAESCKKTPPLTNAPTQSIGEINALKSAKDYLNAMPFSYSGLVEQLEYEGYTHSEAVYGADNCGADWNEQAALSARSYLDSMSFSRQGLIEQLEYEGFTHAQAVYGVEQNGY